VVEEIELESLRVDPRVEGEQKDRLAALREQRNNDNVTNLLSKLEETAKGAGSLMPLFIECAEAHVTLGEICDRLRAVWGQYQPPSFI